jgi:DNA topoisomerase-1
VNHDGKYANLPTSDEVFTIGLNRAVSVLAEAKSGRGASNSVIKELGEHPADGKPVRVMKGRFGPYVTHNKVNATLPRDSDPEAVTMDEAVPLLESNAAKPKKGKTAKKSTAKKATAKKTTAKKAAAKKSSGKKSGVEKTASETK